MSGWKPGGGVRVSYWLSCLGQVHSPFNSLSFLLCGTGPITTPVPEWSGYREEMIHGEAWTISSALTASEGGLISPEETDHKHIGGV